ncbi:MAG: hypothetical protein EXR76_02585 [Myxococcales bacterium]|nr:hypothetical protein [Myxococcales bacterium]
MHRLQRPLYYFVGTETLAYASEIKALLRHPQLRARPDANGLNEYLALQLVIDDGTLRFFRDGLFGPMDRRYFRLIDRLEDSTALLSAYLRASTTTESTFQRFAKLLNHPKTKSDLNRMFHFDQVAVLPALLHVEDRVSMAASLESKSLLRHAYRDLLPSAVYQRKDKMGFPVPLHLWVQGEAGTFFRDVLSSQRCREPGLYDSAAIDVALHDPYVRAGDQNLKKTGLDAHFTRDLDVALKGAVLAFVSQPHELYRQARAGLFLERLPTLIGVFDGCNLYSAAEFRSAGMGYLGIGRGTGRPTEALVEQVIRAFRDMELAVANELSELIEDLNARYGTSFDRVEFTEVQRLAGTCVTGCDIATPEPRSPFASTSDYAPLMRTP